MSQYKKSQFSLIEEEIMALWEKERTFEASLKQREGKPYFSFYDGPPFANGLPHYGHVVPSTIKDAMGRYKTMQGYYVPRIAGWDTHGLPVEYEVEKQLGISGKKQIMEMGVEKFNQACRDSVFKYKTEFEHFIKRLGRWIDLENAYATLDDEYIESVWWVLSELHQKGLVYQGFRSMPYCPRCATPLSNFELNQGYQDDVEDPSVYAVFPLKDDPKVGLLAWTTTPWTLPANAALAVKLDADYVTVELKKPENLEVKQLILAKSRLSELELRKSEYKIIKTSKGKDLVGIAYEPLYEPWGISEAEAKTVHRVYADESVSLEDGTGVLHVAPRYGEADLGIGQRESLPLLESVDANGNMTKATGEFAGMNFKVADEHIVADLTHKKRIFAAEKFKHTYPFCWRCDSPLLYFATPSWFVSVSKIRKELVNNNQQIQWVPDHIKKGRFGNWLAEARDWGFSRNRFWGAPLPIWQCVDGHTTVVGSVKELKKKALNPEVVKDLHRPGIDKVKINCPDCQKPANRVEEVFDCWFESGAMPYGQAHYPIDNQDEFKKGFPADFISEGLDQTRGWFYTLHVLATGLFDQPAYKNVVCHGIVLAADGKKLSKRLRNYPPLEEVFELYGADVLRFFMLNSPVVAGESVRFGSELLKETQRNVFMTLWNVYSFYNTYTKIDKWRPKSLKRPTSNNILDKWIIARLDEAVVEVTKYADKYRLDKATAPLVSFVDDLSNWYVRRSRRRFWKSEDDGDKLDAYATLHHVLVTVTQLFAPWSPFLSDKIYRDLTDGVQDSAKSVHLSDWPEPEKVSQTTLKEMTWARSVINEGLSQRAEASIKVRQPLASVTLTGSIDGAAKYQEIIAEELNVKSVNLKPGTKQSVKVDVKLTDDLKAEGTMRDLVRVIQNARKNAGLNVEDRINLVVKTQDQLITKALNTHLEAVKAETLALTIEVDGFTDHKETAKVAGTVVEIGITKTK